MNKDRQIISELNSFFAESNNTNAIQGIMNVMSHITLTHRQMDYAKAVNCKFTASPVLELMVLFPIFAIKKQSQLRRKRSWSDVRLQERHVLQVPLQRGHQLATNSVQRQPKAPEPYCYAERLCQEHRSRLLDC